MRSKFVMPLTIIFLFGSVLNGLAVVKMYVPEVFRGAFAEIAKEYSGGRVEILSDECSVNRDMVNKKETESKLFLLSERLDNEHMLGKDNAEYSYLISFASSQMVLAYANKSKFSSIINQENWPYYLRKKEVSFGLVNNFNRICNVRPLLALKLAAYNYSQPGLYDTLYNHSVKFESFDSMVSSLKNGEIDYFITYKSSAIENGLKYIELPNMVSLSDDCFREKYRKTYVDLPQSDGSLKRFYGDCISFMLAVKKDDSKSQEIADFIRFVLSDNSKAVLEKRGFNVSYSPEFRGRLQYLDGSLRGLVMYAGF
ncbi:substrate-binding domain-containing protein [Deferribacterales bacterium Es71-Z0220]|uniref:substrate-binding domain-containing protein n=1 Tax=Deferrivibrio essentukiensis TaxID=2880922 RepID=UPI001F5FFCF4|nr:substrate-binding domain-containing protein [Deferrivibrio essentukiensis]MCB4204316.1 substrate-binding domain-containing protein [Deferrivibrio essentukiensis]